MAGKEMVFVWEPSELTMVQFAVSASFSMFFMNLYLGDLLVSGCDTSYILDYFRGFNYCFGITWFFVLVAFYRAKQRGNKDQGGRG